MPNPIRVAATRLTAQCSSSIMLHLKAIFIVAAILALNLQLFRLYEIILCSTLCHTKSSP